MGEAGRRKKNDPNYGKSSPPKNGGPKEAQTTVDERGLIISNPMEVSGDGVLVKQSWLDEQDLRFSLLYWDKLVWPKNKLIDMSDGIEDGFLRSAGVLSRPEPKRMFGPNSDSVLASHFSIFEELSALQPGQWAIAQGENSLKYQPGYVASENGRGAIIELQRAIPIPDVDVPLAEILEFKQRRRDELLLLRSVFEGFVKEIESSQDPEGTLNDRLQEVNLACSDLVRVGQEWQWPVKVGSWNASVTLEPSKMISFGASAYAFLDKAYSVGLPGCIAAGVGSAIVATLSAKPTGITLQSIKKPTNPYRYAYSIDKELRYIG